MTRRILAWRFHALGDAIIPVYYLGQLGKFYPDLQIDYVCPPGVADLAQASTGIRQTKPVELRFMRSWQQVIRLIPRVRAWRGRYDILLDLQHNRAASIASRFLGTHQTGRFDRFGRLSAGERTVNCIRSVGLDPDNRLAIEPRPGLTLLDTQDSVDQQQVLRRFDLDTRPYVVFNPAAALPTRFWPLDNYCSLLDRLDQSLGSEPDVVLLGISKGAKRLEQLASRLPGRRVVNLVDQTTLLHAQQILAGACGLVSEDSGLMHLAWMSGVPTVAIMGNSPTYWSRPLGPHTRWFGSEHLDCAFCKAEACPLGHTRCITDVTVEHVLAACLDVFHRPQ